jgi:hypothetical protein
MPNTITIRKAFSAGDDAAAARDRLASAGFAREDIAVDRVDQHFELSIHTAPEHAQRFRDAINSSDLTVHAARYVRLFREHARPAAQSVLLLGIIAAMAGALTYALRRNHQRWVNDRGNIDRRWDRPDRLADTRHEEARWRDDQRFTHHGSADHDQRALDIDRPERGRLAAKLASMRRIAAFEPPKLAFRGRLSCP